MAALGETPKGQRIHIAFFGRCNAGKSTLINALAGQEVAIVSDTPGTTTDPVSKAMEILPLGPCLLTDTAGLDDTGELGALRIKKTRAVLETADIAVIVTADTCGDLENALADTCRTRGIPSLVYRRGEDLDAFKAALSRLSPQDVAPLLVGDIVSPGDIVVCVTPIDEAAPKGRLILPQQLILRELLDAHAVGVVCQVDALGAVLSSLKTPPRFVITDSQVFGEVDALVPPSLALTSFSILLARAKGDLAQYAQGAEALSRLRDGDRVLIAEGCSHRRQCGDIATVKLPAWIRAHAQKDVTFDWVSGNDFPDDLSPYALVVHCGGCMLTRRAVLARLARCRAAGVPVTNYGICIAACNGIAFSPDSRMVVRGAKR